MTIALAVREWREPLRQTLKTHPFACYWSAVGMLSTIIMWCVFAISTPPDGRVPLWVTPQATVVPSLTFETGYPVTQITVREFQERAADKPYVVSYWAGWYKDAARTFSTPSLSEQNSPARQIKYLMKEGDLYFLAVVQLEESLSLAYHQWAYYDPEERALIYEYALREWYWMALYCLPGLLSAWGFSRAYSDRRIKWTSY